MSASRATLAISVILFAACCVGAAPSATGAEDRPNILLIVADDQSPQDFQLYNPRSTLRTPVLDSLAARGVVVENACHMGSFSGAVCNPSRHMIMTGRTLWNLPNAPQGRVRSPARIVDNTLPAVFRRAGYATMRTCKRGNSYEGANRQFEFRRDETKRGGTAQSGSPWHAEQVLDFLEQRDRNEDRRPFLIYLGFSHPHDTRDGMPEFLKHYGAVNHTDRSNPPAMNPLQPTLPENYLTQHPFDITHADVRDEVAVSGVWTNRDPATVRNEIGRQFACSELIDQQIGRVLEQLRQQEELARTIVIYTADHGMAIGRHGLMGKQNLYQHTWQVPFIAAGPHIASGQRRAGNVYLLDLLSTLCDLTGVPVPETNQGISMRPVLEGSAETIREIMYGAYSGGSKPGIRCLREGDWKLITWQAPDRGVDEIQLFHLKRNPAELLPQHHHPDTIALTGMQPDQDQTNLAARPEHAVRLQRMQDLLLREMKQLGDPAAR